MNRKIFLFILFISAAAFSQGSKKPIFTVGNETIDNIEFKARYELMPHLSENRDPDSLKKDFLFSLMGEKLWGMEAVNKGFDTSDYFRSSFEPLKKMYLKDALFQQEVLSKVKIAPEEIAQGIFRSRYTLQTYIFPFKDSVSAIKLYSFLKNKVSIDSALKLNQMTRENITSVAYGQLDEPSLETALYKLKPSEFTQPVKTKGNWFVFYLANRNAETNKSDDEIKSKVKELLKEKKSREVGLPFLKKMFSGIKSDVNKQLFERLVDLTEDIVINKVPDDYEKKQGGVYLNEATVQHFINNFSDTLYQPLFTYNGKNKVTLKDFLYNLKFEAIKFTKKTRPEISFLIKKRIDSYIEQEILAAEALRRGLDRDEKVLKELNDWKYSYLSQMLRNEFLNKTSASDDEVYQHYLKRVNKVDTVAQINILEILTDKLEIVEQVLNELNNGKDFRELAKLHTIREWTKAKGGEFGLFPVTQNKQFSSIAANMKIGDVYGPIKTDEGYSIIKLIEKKDAVRSFNESYEKVKDGLRNEVIASKLKDAYDDETVKLSNKYGASVNWKNFDQIKLNNIPMFTYRYMGFGGRIAAVPYTTPWFNWVKKNKVIF